MGQRLVLRKVIAVLLSVFVSALFLLATGIAVARVALPKLDEHKDFLGDWLSHIVHQKVVIKDVRATWFRFTPYVQFDDVAIGDNTSSGFHVREMDVALSLWDSILARSPRPGNLIIKGVHLDLQQQGKKFVLYGAEQIKQPMTTDDKAQANTADSKSVSVTSLVSWLLRQTDISITDLTLNVFLANHTAIQAQSINLHTFNKNGNHRLVFSAALRQMIATKIYLVADVADASDSDNYDVKFYGNAQNILSDQVLQLIHANLPNKIKILQGDVSANFWGSWQHGKLQRLHALLDAKNIGLENKKTTSFLALLDANLLWQSNTDGWELIADQIKTKFAGRVIDNIKFGIKHNFASGINNNLFSLSGMYIPDVLQVMRVGGYISPELDAKYANVNINGLIKNLYLQQMSGDQPSWQAQATIDGFTAKHLNTVMADIPDISPVNLDLYVNPDKGALHLQGENVSLALQKIYNHDLQFTKLLANVDWQKNSDGLFVSVPHVEAKAPDMQINTGFKLWLRPNLPAYIDLLGNAKVSDAKVLRNYIPNHFISPALISWLEQAFVAGSTDDCSFLLHGNVKDFPFRNHSGKFEVATNVNDLAIMYNHQWPMVNNLSGNLLFNNDAMHAEINSGSIAGIKINKAVFDIKDFRRAVLLVNGGGYGDAAAGVKFLTTSPLTIGKYLKGTKTSGAMNVHIAMSLPLYKHLENTQISGLISANDVDWNMPAWDIDLTKMQGMLQFNQDSVTANNIAAQLLGGPTVISVKTKNYKSGAKINIDLVGSAAVDDLRTTYQIPSLYFAKGNFNYLAALNLYPSNSGHSTLRVSSDLRGTSIDLPGILNKSSQQKSNLIYELSLDNAKILPMKISYDKIFAAQLVVSMKDSAAKLLDAVFDIGRVGNLNKLRSGLIYADVNLPEINYSDWQSVYHNYQLEALQMGQDMPSDNIIRFDISTKLLKAYNNNLSNMNIRVDSIANGWRVAVQQKNVTGVASWFTRKQQLYVYANFAKLYLENFPNNAAANNINAENFPAIDFTCVNGSLGKYSFANLHLLSVPYGKHTYVISDLTFDPPFSQVKLHGAVDVKNTKVNLTGNLNTNDLGSFLHAWNFDNFISEANGEGYIDISWSKNIFKPSIKDLVMKLDVALKKGNFLDIGQNAQNKLGFGRLLNFFSLQSIPHRLTLNFSDLAKKGFGFSHLNSNIDLADGVMRLSDTKIDGAVAKVSASGFINLIAKKCNIKMSVAPHVTSSAPVIATIAGGPVVGAFTWVANKILSPGISRALLAQYAIKGSLSNPQVTELNGGGERNKDALPHPV
jgi:uncharacterized protein (TIGR02099 family)